MPTLHDLTRCKLGPIPGASNVGWFLKRSMAIWSRVPLPGASRTVNVASRIGVRGSTPLRSRNGEEPVLGIGPGLDDDRPLGNRLVLTRLSVTLSSAHGLDVCAATSSGTLGTAGDVGSK